MAQAQIKMNPVTTQAQQINIPKKPVAFRLSPFSASNLPSNTATTLNLTLKEFDLGNNTRGNTFVAPENGVYHFDVHLNFSPQLTDYQNYLRFHLSLLKAGAEIERSSLMSPQTQLTPFFTLNISTTILLKAGEAVSASFLSDANPNTAGVKTNQAFFSGFKVADLEPGNSAGGIR
jgi:hypothetical protein